MFKVNEARMKAIRVHTPGGPEALRYEEIERPAPGPGQVLVKIAAAGRREHEAGRRRNAPGHDGALPRDLDLRLEARGCMPDARRRGRRGSLALPDRQTPGRTRARHGLDAREGRPGTRGRRR